MPFELCWQGYESLITRVVYGDGSANEEQDSELCVVGWGLWHTHVSDSLFQPGEHCLFSSLMWRGQNSSACLCSFASHGFVEQGVNQRGRSATESSVGVADFWCDVWREIDD